MRAALHWPKPTIKRPTTAVLRGYGVHCQAASPSSTGPLSWLLLGSLSSLCTAHPAALPAPTPAARLAGLWGEAHIPPFTQLGWLSSRGEGRQEVTEACSPWLSPHP